MPSIAQLLPLLGEDYERKCIELGIIQRAQSKRLSVYGTLNGMTRCLNCGADYIPRLRTNSFAVYDENGKRK